MNERTWGVVVWLGLLGAIGAVIATFAAYLALKDTGYALVFFIVAMLFAIMGAVANVAATRARRQRWDGEMAAQQQRVDELFASARAEGRAKHLGPEAGSIADEAAAAGASVDAAADEHKRAEHGNWE